MNGVQQYPQTHLLKLAMIVVIGMIVIVVGVGAYIWFAGGTGQPTTPISAPVLTPGAVGDGTLFRIVPEESQVRFSIEELLLGEPKTVIGVTDQVAGDILIDFDQPRQSKMGAIRINVNTLKTDNEFRNRALRGQILQSTEPEFEFAEFVPTAIDGLPNAVQLGEALTFTLTGGLTVRGVTRSITFEVTATPVSETRLEGTAQATVRYTDFGMSIPEAPGVANIADEVGLEIVFAALAVER